MPVVRAHQGGWDEALVVVVPVALFVGLLLLANRRARARQRDAEDDRRADPGR